MEVKIDGFEYKNCCKEVQRMLDDMTVDQNNNIKDAPNPDVIVDVILEILGIKA